MPGSFLTSFEKPPAKIFLIPSAINSEQHLRIVKVPEVSSLHPLFIRLDVRVYFLSHALFLHFLRRKSAFLFFFASCFLWPKMYTIKTIEKIQAPARRRLHLSDVFCIQGIYYIRFGLSLWKGPPRGLYLFNRRWIIHYLSVPKHQSLRAAKFKTVVMYAIRISKKP